MEENEEVKGKRIIKATLSAVLNAQEQLRKHIMQLIEENRPLKDENERALFIKEWNYATLGFGKDFEISFSVEEFTHSSTHNTDYFARYLSIENRNEITYHRKEIIHNKEITVNKPISFHWNHLLHGAFEIFPYAIERATSMSKEQETQTRTKGFNVG